MASPFSNQWYPEKSVCVKWTDSELICINSSFVYFDFLATFFNK